MKFYFIIPVLAAFALAGCAATAQPPTATESQHPPSAADTDQRFDRMDKMMEQAQMARGPQRHQRMGEHMQMMQHQMQAMHAMMGPRSGRGPQMQQMQGRMDMMQRLMEQKMKRHELMTKPDTEK